MDIHIPIELCNSEAIMPKYAHDTDGAMDIYSVEDYSIGPHQAIIVKTGIKVAIPKGYAILIQPRSGMSAKTPLRIPNTPGLIDAGYRDEIGVIMENTSDYTFYISQGDRVAQMRLVEIPHIVWDKTKDVSLFVGDRGGGFGSTGK